VICEEMHEINIGDYWDGKTRISVSLDGKLMVRKDKRTKRLQSHIKVRVYYLFDRELADLYKLHHVYRMARFMHSEGKSQPLNRCCEYTPS